MNSFESLLDAKACETPGITQARANRDFPSLILQSRFHLWAPGNAIESSRRRILLGIAATYSLPDLRLLDALQVVVSTRGIEDHIDVFDWTNLKSTDELSNYFPGIPEVQTTPIVGTWKRGILERVAWGWEGRVLIETLYDFRS